MKDTILKGFAFNLFFINKLVEDIPDEKICEQPGGLVNHPAWVIGHLVIAASSIGQMIGARPSAPDGWKELFDMGSQPTGDTSKYPDKATLLAALEKSHKVFAKAYEDASESTLNQELPMEQLRPMFPTVGDFAAFGMTGHEGVHIGQLTAWRHVQGLPKTF